MYDLGLRYLARAFVDAMSIDTGPSAMASLMQELKLGDLEVITAVEQIGQVRSPRPLFRSKDGSWQLLLTTQSFDISLLPTESNGGKLGSFADFCRRSAAVLGTCVTSLDRKAHRLAAVQEGFLGEMAEGEMNKIALRLFRLPPVFRKQVPFEWDWRCASRVTRSFASSEESTNTLATIKRLRGTIDKFSVKEGPVPFDRIRVDLDINTSDENRATRFTSKSIVAFFDKTHSWHHQLSEEILRLVHGKTRK